MGFAQPNLPGLAEIKTAAERGDPQAQDKLGETYFSGLNFSDAARWFEKAAEKGIIHAQWRLGQILLNGEPKVAEGSSAVAEQKEEGIKFLLLAANQGLAGAQLDIGQCYATGKGLKKEYAEAYKWLRLASPGGSITEKIHLDPVILKMTVEQLQEGERRVKAFIPAAPNSKEATLAPPYMKDIMLKAISGPSNHRLVLINNHTFEKGEEARVKVGERTLSIKCLDIRVRSAVISIEGTAEPKEIKLRD